MAEMHLCDHLEELWMRIQQQHLLYLVSDDIPGKLQQREKLESYIKEYLCIAPHNWKFTFPQTAQILHSSASNKENFSGYKAALAWKAIGKYADNLVVQPWRKEFKDLKLYCGFYKHEVEENLSDAELMFEAMGYCRAGNSTMTITDILDPDRITSVSKDAIVAYVECQILKQIWDNLTPYYNFTWLEILEFRENHTGTPVQAIRSLRYKRHQRQYEEQMYRRSQYLASEGHPQQDYGYNPGYYNHVHYPGHSYPYPVQPRFASMTVPQVSPTTMYPPQLHPVYGGAQQVIKPHDLYPPNGYHVHSHYPPQDPYHNPNYHPVHPQQVPTAQLIELDSTPVQSEERPQNKYSNEDKWQDFDKGEEFFSSGKAKDDGAGSWENWDYVYRNLGSQGYKKNGSRDDVPSSKGNSTKNNSGDSEGKAQGKIIEKIRKMNLGTRSVSKESSGKSADDEETKTKGSRRSSDHGREQEDGRGSGSSPAKSNRVGSPVRVKKEETEVDLSRDRKSSSKTFEAEANDSEEKWECISCTYLNSFDKQICQMCYKSKERGDESKPQPTGGQECRNCTLVNERGLNFCVACSEPLKDSPTYI